jgi:hypothetical protein
MGWGCGLNGLSNKLKALDSNPITTKKKKINPGPISLIAIERLLYGFLH